MNQFDSLLFSKGFSITYGERRVFDKDDENFKLTVTEIEDFRRPDRVSFHLGVAIKDPFLFGRAQSVACLGVVAKGGVRIGDWREVIYWNPEGGEKALCEYFDAYVWEWFERHTDSDYLVDYFTKGLENGVPVEKHRLGIGMAMIVWFMTRVVWRAPANMVDRPPNFNYFLSLVHLTRGELELSKTYAVRWREFLITLPPETAERRRTDRHLEFLERELG